MTVIKKKSIIYHLIKTTRAFVLEPEKALRFLPHIHSKSSLTENMVQWAL
jgi:predicted DNA-binding protein YlxM (UPF0122 family)